MSDYPQWSQLKPILDDPNVSNSDKQRLLNDYAAAGVSLGNSDYFNNQDQIQQYAQQYGSTDAFGKAQSNFFDGTPPSQASQQAYQSQLQRAQNDQQAGQANQDLTSAAGKTVAQGGSGVNTSDEILDPGSRGMHFFEYFIPPYKNWTGGGPDLAKDIETVYDNLRGINIGKFRADATQLSTSHGKLSDITMNLSTNTNSLGGFWQGPAAQAAQQYTGQFMQNAQTVTDGTTAASQVIDTSMTAIESAVLQRAQAVLQMYATDIGGFSPDDIQEIIDTAKNNASDDELRSMAKWQVFSNVDWGDTNCSGDLSQNVKNLAAMDATQWLNQTFVPTFNQKLQAFDQVTKSTHDAVGQAFDSMNQGLGQINPNPFSDLSAGIQVPTSPSQTNQGTGSGSGSGRVPGLVRVPALGRVRVPGRALVRVPVRALDRVRVPAPVRGLVLVLVQWVRQSRWRRRWAHHAQRFQRWWREFRWWRAHDDRPEQHRRRWLGLGLGFRLGLGLRFRFGWQFEWWCAQHPDPHDAHHAHHAQWQRFQWQRFGRRWFERQWFQWQRFERQRFGQYGFGQRWRVGFRWFGNHAERFQPVGHRRHGHRRGWHRRRNGRRWHRRNDGHARHRCARLRDRDVRDTRHRDTGRARHAGDAGYRDAGFEHTGDADRPARPQHAEHDVAEQQRHHADHHDGRQRPAEDVRRRVRPRHRHRHGDRHGPAHRHGNGHGPAHRDGTPYRHRTSHRHEPAHGFEPSDRRHGNRFRPDRNTHPGLGHH